ncbi:MAG: excinuclease ABC subunit UvrA [Bacteroidales bacterium]|jgi:excinuclease ABC subunit A|nr:excinuclease ABC subunit UvrA [Bacteroidales bacterium]
MSEGNIIIKGARVNNLKSVDVDIPRGQFVVITGLSGSGKTSLAFDTLYAEGQRRYVESLSSYARQFMGKIAKPDVDSISGIAPAIVIEQKVINRNVRSTVGTTTEIYEYLKLLFARAGHTFSPISQKEVKRETVSDVVSYIQGLHSGAKVYILAPLLVIQGRTLAEQIEICRQQGFHHIVHHEKIMDIEDLQKQLPDNENDLYLLIDRLKVKNLSGNMSRLADSVQIAFAEGKGTCMIQVEDHGHVQKQEFSNRFEMDGMVFEEPTVNLFSFNNPYGACKTCGGAGIIDDISPDLVIPDPSLSVFDGAVACWKGEKLGEWKNYFILHAGKTGFPVHRPVEDLSKEDYHLLWHGDKTREIYGVKQFFEFVTENLYKIQYRVIQSRYRGRTPCPDCLGTHLRADANYVKVDGKSISDLLIMPIIALHDFFQNIKLKNENEKKITKHVINELIKRTGFLTDVGLGYLTLNRSSNSLSGGESQRINLARTLGSSLVGSLYILDEPSIGLHSRDTRSLIKVLHRLRDIGNTVIVVEHDEEIIRAADYIIDLGPGAGQLGGNVIFQGTFDQLIKTPDNLTADYIKGMDNKHAAGAKTIPLPKIRRPWRNYIEIIGAKEHNLKNINVKIPLNVFVVVTGVSGSGKSSLIRDILYPAVERLLETGNPIPGKHTRVDMDKRTVSEIIMVDQNPIGRSTRSNPVTYIKAFDDIRELFAEQPLAKQRGYKSGFFSLNVKGGRCEECEGEGVVHVSMQFMADVNLTCPECAGNRYRDEALDIKINGQTIQNILDMTIKQSVDFFKELPQNKLIDNIISKLSYLQDVGLGYLKMGQSSSTLSGGEAQRVKIASYLTLENNVKQALFIFDEPTTGLHFHDINQLYASLSRLIERGNSVVVIEHNAELIKCADWIIDLGPEGGAEGGNIVFEGTPENIAKCKNSYTGKCLKNKV